MNADVLLLSEVDVGCARTGYVDVGLVLAKALHMNYVFCTEFVELASPLRPAHLQGGGVHGNAILSRYELSHVHSALFRAQPGAASWRESRDQPRRGGRCYVSALVHTPQGAVRVYSVHLEVLCGPVARVQQFLEVYEHAEAHRYESVAQIIGGDFNTHAHGLARFLCDPPLPPLTPLLNDARCSRPQFITSWSDLTHRVASLGVSEPAWWQASLFTRASSLPVRVYDDAGVPLVVPDCSRFQDPWDKDKDATIGWYGGLWSNKCDWLLVSGADILSKAVRLPLLSSHFHSHFYCGYRLHRGPLWHAAGSRGSQITFIYMPSLLCVLNCSRSSCALNSQKTNSRMPYISCSVHKRSLRTPPPSASVPSYSPPSVRLAHLSC